MVVDNTITKLKAYFDKWHAKDEHINLIYPKGSIYISVDSNFKPADSFGGTWEKIEGQFLLGSGNGFNFGDTGGNADAQLIKHKHTQTAHTHEQTAHTHNQTNHNHTAITTKNGEVWNHLLSDGDIKVGDSGCSFGKLNDGNKFPVYCSGNNYGNISQHDTGPGKANIQTTKIEIKTSQPEIQETGTLEKTDAGDAYVVKNANLPPYIVVHIWKRTE